MFCCHHDDLAAQEPWGSHALSPLHSLPQELGLRLEAGCRHLFLQIAQQGGLWGWIDLGFRLSSVLKWHHLPMPQFPHL